MDLRIVKDNGQASRPCPLRKKKCTDVEHLQVEAERIIGVTDSPGELVFLMKW